MNIGDTQDDYIVLKPEHLVVPEEYRKVSQEKFGRAQAGALGLSALGAGIASASGSALTSALSGIGAEKVGLFLAFFVDACKKYVADYKTGTLKSIGSYFGHVRDEGYPELVKDVTIHDPMYGAFTWGGVAGYEMLGGESGSISTSIISIISFIVAFYLVPYVDEAKQKQLYKRFHKRMKKKGAIVDKYYETKLVVHEGGRSDEMLEDMIKECNLADYHKLKYWDSYYKYHKRLKKYDGRWLKVRTRKRYEDEINLFEDSLQIVTKKVREVYNQNRKFDQYRYYPVEKHKVTFPLHEENRSRILKEYTATQEILSTLEFEREYANNEETAYFAIDKFKHKPGSYIVEIKTRQSDQLITELTRKILTDYDSEAFTVGKEYVM